MIINDLEIEVDIEEELSEYEWENANWTSTKLIANSPFRTENKPSFFVLLEENKGYPAGTWSDSGGTEYESGNFISLLSFLRDETEEEIKDYLLEKYGYTSAENKYRIRKLKIKKEEQIIKPLPLSLLNNLFKHSYLETRGISQGIQNVLKIGYNKSKKAISIPWFFPDEQLANIKYRRIDSKRFFYEKGGYPIAKLLFGINILLQKEYLETVVVTEAEIDAISCMVAGFPAVAVGGKSWNNYKRDLLMRTNIKNVIIATDNDDVGEKLRLDISNSLKGRYSIRHARFLFPSKDCNDELVSRGKESLNHIFHSAKPEKTFSVNLKCC